MADHSRANHTLIEEIAAGSESALHALYAEYGQRMYAYALRLTGDPARADDITQESLVAVWQGARRFRAEGRVISWLLGIVHHQTMRSFRGNKELPLDEDHPPGEAVDDGNPYHQFDNQQAIRHALRQLPIEQRAVLELVFFNGLSLKEAAVVCDCPLGTIKSRLSLAKSALRAHLRRSGLDQEDF